MTIRLFQNEDAVKVSKLVAKTMMISNIKDYSKSHLESSIQEKTPEFLLIELN